MNDERLRELAMQAVKGEPDSMNTTQNSIYLLLVAFGRDMIEEIKKDLDITEEE